MLKEWDIFLKKFIVKQICYYMGSTGVVFAQTETLVVSQGDIISCDHHHLNAPKTFVVHCCEIYQ